MTDRVDRREEKSGQRAPTGANGAGEGTTPRSVPRDAHAIMAMFKELGVSEYDPRCVTQLLEFAHRYVTAVLEDARAFANHAKKKSVEADDVRLAAAAHAERSFSTPPPREVLLELTRGRNSTPLPLVKPHCGIRLPPDRFCLSARNYKLGRSRKARPTPTTTTTTSAQGTKRPGTLMTVSKTQAVSVPKPVFKFTTAGKSSAKTIRSENEPRKTEDSNEDYDAL